MVPKSNIPSHPGNPNDYTNRLDIGGISAHGGYYGPAEEVSKGNFKNKEYFEAGETIPEGWIAIPDQF